MTATTAKRITLTILDRWGSIPAGGHNIKFVILKNRVPVGGRQDTGYIFNSRFAALAFASAHYRRDFALLALTENGSVDMTPP